MKTITLGQRLRYWFDNSLSRGTASLIGWLAVISLLMVLIATTILVFTGLKPQEDAPEEAPAVAEQVVDSIGDDADKPKVDSASSETKEKAEAAKEAEPAKKEEGYSFAEAFWQSLMRSMDAGSVAGDTGWWFRLVMFIVTIGGIFIMGSLIGVLTSGLEGKLEELRKGRSFVCEENHTLILGWSSRIFLIISELIEANKNAVKPRIVILADKDKVEMEDEIRAHVENTYNTKIVCRSGNPIDLTDLEIVNPHSSKSVIVLSPEESSDPDSQVIKQILALTNNPNRREEPYHIVAELRDKKNYDVAKMVGKDEVEVVTSSDLISRITVQTSLQTGLSLVYKDLLDFGGDEVYFSSASGLAGKTYGEAVQLFGDCSLIGLESGGSVKLNPTASTTISANDKVIAIASDDDKVRVSGSPSVADGDIKQGVSTKSNPVKVLILGWNHRGATIVREMNNYVVSGSELTVVADIDEAQSEVESMVADLKNLKVEFEKGDTADRVFLDSLDLTTYQHIILLCYADSMDANEADSKTLMTLLHLRDIESKKGEAFSVVSEMLDVKNRALAEIAKADDFIVSDELTGLLLTQISDNKQLGKVFEDLFDSDGAEVYLKPAGDYVSLDKPVNFYTVCESAKRRNETPIGYRIAADADNADKYYGVKVNPVKGENITFSADDKVIVLADC